MNIQNDQLRWLSDTIKSVYVARSFNELSARLVHDLETHFHPVITACDSSSFDGSHYSMHIFRGHVKPRPDFHLYLWDSPIVVRLMAGDRAPVLQLSDSRNQLVHTEFYNNLCRHIGYSDQLLLSVWDERRLTAFSVNRDLPFTTRERFLAEILQPHIRAAFFRVRNDRQNFSGSVIAPWIEIGAARAPLGLTLAQCVLLKIYFPSWSVRTQSFPEPLGDWVENCELRFKRGAHASPLRAMKQKSKRGCLVMRYFPSGHGANGAIRVAEIPSTYSLQSMAVCAALSTREADVLQWLILGKRDGEIAKILGSAPKTVSKHIEHIFKKLGVETRTAAAAVFYSSNTSSEPDSLKV